VLVTEQVQPIHRLMAGEPGNAPIDGILLRIGQVEHQLRTMGAGLADPELREIVRSLQQEAATLPPVVQSLIGQIGRKAEGTVVASATSELEKRYLQEVQRECSQVVVGRYPFTPGSSTDLPLGDFARLFGYGGVFDKFFQENLDPLVDRTQSPWTWRSGAVQGPHAILEQFEKAQGIRELFFRRGTGAMEIRFHVTIVEADAAAIRFTLEIDGNFFEYRVPVRSAIGTWPGPNPGTAAVTWYEKYGGQPRVSFLSPWAWFRLIDAAREERESDVRSALTFQYSGHRSRVMLEATSVSNPFSNRDWQRFTCQF
jgi:type VI secretion system protein ImpL